jgi:hypothetical protein
MKKNIFICLFMVISSVFFAQGTSYNIGDTGPAKGIVFYDKGVFSDGWRYLEAYPTETGYNVQWGAYKYDVPGTEPVIGSGKRNTELIIEIIRQVGGARQAAQLCASFEFNGFSDWFLPSKDELDMMYKNLKLINLGNFTKDKYWSSTQFTKDMAYNLGFNNGKSDRSHKDKSCNVRPIRAF